MVTVEAADTTPRAPSNVMAVIGGDPGQPVIVTWTDGANAEAHGVVLFTSDFSLTEHIARGMGGTHTFENVGAGSYIAVVVVLDALGGLVTDADGDYLTLERRALSPYSRPEGNGQGCFRHEATSDEAP